MIWVPIFAQGPLCWMIWKIGANVKGGVWGGYWGLTCYSTRVEEHNSVDQHFDDTWTVRNIGGTRVLVPGHQNSGAPPFFWGVFLMVYSHLCWQCSNKNRKCREHINTLGKKDKLIFLKPIFEIKTKNLLSTWKGTRVLVPGHQNSGAPTNEDTQPRKYWKNCGGTRVLVPGHQNSGALSSWQQVFCFNLKNGL